jgi:hypothetical protein
MVGGGWREVIDAHTLRYEDATVVDLNGGMDAPDLAQRGRIDGKLYPAGEEAANFLRSLVGNKPVTSYAEADDKDWTKQKNFTKVDALLGETCLSQETGNHAERLGHGPSHRDGCVGVDRARKQAGHLAWGAHPAGEMAQGRAVGG